MIGNSNDETTFPYKSLLTDTQVSKIFKAFANGLSANIKFLRTRLSKIIQLGGLAHNFLDFFVQLKRLFLKQMSYLRKVSLNDILEGFNFAKNVLQASKKSFGAGITLTDNEIKDIMKVIKSLENRGILLKGTTRNITSQKEGF